MSDPECTSGKAPCFKVDRSIRPKGGRLSCKTYDGKKEKIPCRIKNKNNNSTSNMMNNNGNAVI